MLLLLYVVTTIVATIIYKSIVRASPPRRHPIRRPRTTQTQLDLNLPWTGNWLSPGLAQALNNGLAQATPSADPEQRPCPGLLE